VERHVCSGYLVSAPGLTGRPALGIHVPAGVGWGEVAVWERCSQCMDTATGPPWEEHDNCHSRQHNSCCAPSMSVLMWVGMLPWPCSGCVQCVLESGIQSAGRCAAVVPLSLNVDQQAACGIGLHTTHRRQPACLWWRPVWRGMNVPGVQCSVNVSMCAWHLHQHVRGLGTLLGQHFNTAAVCRDQPEAHFET
jgi:hypothetical protein